MPSRIEPAVPSGRRSKEKELKNYLIGALLICAIPAVAAGQVIVSCETCTHEVSVYMGSGGFIATAATDDDDEMVTWVATCGGVTTSGELKPNDDGVVSDLFSMDNGLACNAEGGSFQIGPVEDGGWFWINDADNSAVGSLVARDLFDDKGKPLADEVEPADAGDSVTATAGKGAVLLKHASGRVGILPTLLPEAPMEPAKVNNCSYTGNGSGAPYARETANCMLGDGRTVIRVLGPQDPYTGKPTDGGRIVRPAAGSVTATVDLWGNGSGHILTATGASAFVPRTDSSPARPEGYNFLTGHPGGSPLVLSASGEGNDTTGGFTASLGQSVGVGTPIEGTTAVGGMTFAVTENVGTLTIGPAAAYCAANVKPPVNHTAVVTVKAYVAGDQENQVTPMIHVGPGNRLAATTTINVVCPAASANRGVELVPDNPFPPTFE